MMMMMMMIMYMKKNKKELKNIVSSLHVNFHFCSSQSRESKQILSFVIENLPNIGCILLVQLCNVAYSHNTWQSLYGTVQWS